MNRFVSKYRTIFSMMLAAVLCCGLLFTGCGSKEDDSRIAKPEEFAGIWEPVELVLGGNSLDVSQTSFSLELNEDYTGSLTSDSKTQDIKWEIRGFKGEYTDVRIAVTIPESFPIYGIDADLKGLNLLYSTEDHTLSFDESWTGSVNGMDARFTVSGILEKK